MHASSRWLEIRRQNIGHTQPLKTSNADKKALVKSSGKSAKKRVTQARENIQEIEKAFRELLKQIKDVIKVANQQIDKYESLLAVGNVQGVANVNPLEQASEVSQSLAPAGSVDANVEADEGVDASFDNSSFYEDPISVRTQMLDDIYTMLDTVELIDINKQTLRDLVNQLMDSFCLIS